MKVFTLGSIYEKNRTDTCRTVRKFTKNHECEIMKNTTIKFAVLVGLKEATDIWLVATSKPNKLQP